jgi:hypothetical protein
MLYSVAIEFQEIFCTSHEKRAVTTVPENGVARGGVRTKPTFSNLHDGQ